MLGLGCVWGLGANTTGDEQWEKGTWKGRRWQCSGGQFIKIPAH